MSYNILFLGYGNIAKRHIQNLCRYFDIASLTVVRASSNIISENFSVPVCVYTDLSEALTKKHYHCAFICSPASLHLDHFKALHLLSIPCFIEKPITAHISQAKELLHFLGIHPAPTLVGYDLCYTLGFEKVASFLREKKLGEIWRIDAEVGQYLPQWRPEKDYRNSVSARSELGGGALRELSHELDYLLALFDFNSMMIQSTLINNPLLEMDCENEVNILAQALLDDQLHPISLHVHLNMLQKRVSRSLRIYGSNGELEWDLITQDITFFSDDKLQAIVVKECSNDPYIRLISEFMSSWENKDISMNSINRAAEVMSLIEKIELSSRLKRAVKYDKG